jgi:hypothetical protein
VINTRLPLLALAFTGAAIVVAACGGSGGTADESPSQIAAATKQAAQAASSFHIKGDANSSGTLITLDLTVKEPHAVQGSMSISGKGSFQIATTDGSTYYMTPDDQFWSSYASPPAAQVLSGKCLTASAGDSGFGQLTEGFGKLTDLGSLFSTTDANSLTKGSQTTVDGQSAIPLTDSKGNELDVAATGQPLPLRLKGTGGTDIQFDQWNSDVTISPPQGCLSVSDLQQQLGGAAPTPTP